jgi:hypothetical protein
MIYINCYLYFLDEELEFSKHALTHLQILNPNTINSLILVYALQKIVLSKNNLQIYKTLLKSNDEYIVITEYKSTIFAKFKFGDLLKIDNVLVKKSLLDKYFISYNSLGIELNISQKSNLSLLGETKNAFLTYSRDFLIKNSNVKYKLNYSGEFYVKHIHFKNLNSGIEIFTAELVSIEKPCFKSVLQVYNNKKFHIEPKSSYYLFNMSAKFEDTLILSPNIFSSFELKNKYTTQQFQCEPIIQLFIPEPIKRTILTNWNMLRNSELGTLNGILLNVTTKTDVIFPITLQFQCNFAEEPTIFYCNAFDSLSLQPFISNNNTNNEVFELLFSQIGTSFYVDVKIVRKRMVDQEKTYYNIISLKL